MTAGAFSRNVGKLFSELKLVTDNLSLLMEGSHTRVCTSLLSWGDGVMTSCLNIEKEDIVITFCSLTVDTYRGAATGGVLPEHSDGQQQK